MHYQSWQFPQGISDYSATWSDFRHKVTPTPSQYPPHPLPFRLVQALFKTARRRGAKPIGDKIRPVDELKGANSIGDVSESHGAILSGTFLNSALF